MWSVTSNAIGMALPKQCGVYIFTVGAGPGNIDFNACPLAALKGRLNAHPCFGDLGQNAMV